MNVNQRNQEASISKRNKWIAPIILFITIPIICCSLASGISMLTMLNNNRLLQDFASNLYEYPLPPQTEVVSRDARVELLGNGNHCDFVAEQTMISDLTQEEIKSYYDDIQLPGAHNDSQMALNSVLKIRVDIESSPSDRQTQFVIWVADIGYPPGFDWRCH